MTDAFLNRLSHLCNNCILSWCVILSEYSEIYAVFGKTFSPTAKAAPSSKTRSMTWLLRSLPISLSTRDERNAFSTGIIFDPYQFSDFAIWWIFISAKIFMSKNTPPNLVSITRGSRDNWRISAYSALSVLGRSGRSSSLRLGNLANPSSLRIFQMDDWLRRLPSCIKAKCMSCTELFFFRRAMTRSRDWSRFGLYLGPRLVSTKYFRSGSFLNLWHKTWKAPVEYPNLAATSLGGRFSTKYALSASYWRCFGWPGSKKKRASGLIELLNLYCCCEVAFFSFKDIFTPYIVVFRHMI